MIAKWIIISMFAIGALASIAMIGKERKPTTPAAAIGSVIASCAYIALILIFWK